MITLTREEAQQVEQYIKPYAIVPVDMQTTQLLVNALRAKLSAPESEYKSYQCQQCGEVIGWLGRVMPFHKCAQLKPEPLGWIVMHEGMNIDELSIHEVEQMGYDEKPMPNQYRVYISPSQRKGNNND